MIAYLALGLAIGSFLNLCIDRLPRGESIISPPSHCPACHRRLGVLDLVPVLSYLALRGRCRSCGAAIPLRVLLVEALSGSAFGLLWWWLGSGITLAVFSAYASLFILIAAIDFEHHRILNRVIYPALLSAPLAAVATGLELRMSLLGGVVGFGLLLLLYLAARGGMGAGDVKLAALVGVISGYPGVLVALLAAILCGGIAAVVLLVSGIKSRKDPIPFAPFLVLGAVVALIVGEPLIAWYAQFL